MAKVYDEDDVLSERLTTSERRWITSLILILSLLFAWWTRTELWAVVLSVSVGVTVSICLWVYWLLLDKDEQEEKDYYGWTEDDYYDLD